MWRIVTKRWGVLARGTVCGGRRPGGSWRDGRGNKQDGPGLEPCQLSLPNGQAIPGPVRCGWFPVPENRDRPEGRTIRLRVVVIASDADDPLRDPVVQFLGGPGQAAAQFAAFFAQGHRQLFPRRDLVMVDQRGTGQSNGLYCASDEQILGSAQDQVRHVFDVDDARACRMSLEAQADLSQYHTSIAAVDLAEILNLLGYDRVNVVGGSYGTRMAQVFMRMYPHRVRTAILDGVVAMNTFAPAPYSLETTDAMWRLVESCVADPACGGAFPDLASEVEALFARLDEGPVRTTVQDPISQGVVELEVPKEVFGYAVRGMLYSGQQFPSLPAELHAAHSGDYAPLVQRYLARKVAFTGNALATGNVLLRLLHRGHSVRDRGARGVERGHGDGRRPHSGIPGFMRGMAHG